MADETPTSLLLSRAQNIAPLREEEEPAAACGSLLKRQGDSAIPHAGVGFDAWSSGR
jgi:hypothetical protein